MQSESIGDSSINSLPGGVYNRLFKLNLVSVPFFHKKGNNPANNRISTMLWLSILPRVGFMKGCIVKFCSIACLFLCATSFAFPLEDELAPDNPQQNRTLSFSKEAIAPYCDPMNLILPKDVIHQARVIASQLNGLDLNTLPVTNQEKLKEYWETVSRGQNDFLKSLTDEHYDFDNLSDQSLMPYLFEQQIPDIYEILIDRGLPKNKITHSDLKRWQHTLLHPIITAEGQLISTRPYAQLDPGWLLTGVNYIAQLLGILKKAPFIPEPGRFTAKGDDLKIVLVGDWGSDTEGARGVMNSIKQQNADFVIHLGDVYYSGTVAEEKARFLSNFTSGSQGAFMLNANHEMDGGAQGYFYALKDERFKAQGSSSFFVLENDYWVILGLDSAYYATGVQYNPGRIVDSFQQKLLENYQSRNKKLMILTHHNPIDYKGKKTEDLWDDIATSLGFNMPDYWIYGHKHMGVAYSDKSIAWQKGMTKAFCVGHGGIPEGNGRGFYKKFNSELLDTIDFYAHKPDPAKSFQTTNGYLVIELSKDQLKETFMDQYHNQLWPQK